MGEGGHGGTEGGGQGGLEGQDHLAGARGCAVPAAGERRRKAPWRQHQVVGPPASKGPPGLELE